MKLAHILESYDTSSLDQISADKVDEVLNLRLPQSVIVQEIISALNSQSYISKKILYAKPPTYAILNLLLQAQEYLLPVEGFREEVLNYVKQLSALARAIKSTPEKNTHLYIKILQKAWENDGQIDKSEAHILELVKHELHIWDREHFILTHEESIIKLWNMEQEFYLARNLLVSSGVVLTLGNNYIIADEVAIQIRKAFGVELMDDAFGRMLNGLTKDELAQILGFFQFNVSGSKENLIERLKASHIPPTEILAQAHLESLKDLCRSQGINVSGSKSSVISNIIYHFDNENDLVVTDAKIEQVDVPQVPELREMNSEYFNKVLSNLTGQQLYDILYQAGFMTSGSKEEKVKRIMEGHLSERSIFNFLRKEDLTQLCRRFTLPVSGSKQELVDRVMDYVPSTLQVMTATEQIIDQPATSLPNQELVQLALPKISSKIALPSNWDDVNLIFPDLEKDEKIIVAVLKDAKSITETDLERIVQRYDLGWFLYKAKMAELMAKLKQLNYPQIQIRSIQNANVYQWVGNENTDSVILEKKSARDVIDALRHGVVPRTNLDLLMVGQQTARKHLADLLSEVSTGKSHFKFIRGQYGSGKTFLCSWLKEYALDREFAVSFLNISHDQPLSDLAVFFSGVVSGLRTPEKTDSSALVDILESWLLNVHNRTATIEGLDLANASQRDQLRQAVEKSIELELAKFNDIEPGFSQALRSFYEGKVTADPELVANSVAWITGSRSLSAQALRDIGVKGYLESANVFLRMRAILQIISGARYKGLLLLVDELELVRKFPHARQREQALETLRLLIDEAGRNALPGCLIIFTGTDEFFEDERYGLKSYEALAERVITPFTHESFVSVRQPIIKLESLNKERLAQVIFKIRDLYGAAYSWDSRQFAGDDAILKLIEEWTVFGEENIDRKPRPILREFIQMLDLCEENKGVNISQFLKKSELTAVASPTYNPN